LTKTSSNEKLGKQISEIDNDKNKDIPEPPKFDPVLYKSIGARHKSMRESINAMDGVPAITSKGENPVNGFTVSLRKVKPKPLTLAPEIEKVNGDGEEQPLGIAAIRSKLEEILKRGPQSVYHPRQKSTISLNTPNPTPTNPSTSNDTSLESTPNEDKDNSMNSNISDGQKPNEVVRQKSIIHTTGKDTVSKQKLLFRDVLKSINRDTKPSDVKHTH
jgi:hypothetical protein